MSIISTVHGCPWRRQWSNKAVLRSMKARRFSRPLSASRVASSRSWASRALWVLMSKPHSRWASRPSTSMRRADSELQRGACVPIWASMASTWPYWSSVCMKRWRVSGSCSRSGRNRVWGAAGRPSRSVNRWLMKCTRPLSTSASSTSLGLVSRMKPSSARLSSSLRVRRATRSSSSRLVCASCRDAAAAARASCTSRAISSVVPTSRALSTTLSTMKRWCSCRRAWSVCWVLNRCTVATAWRRRSSNASDWWVMSSATRSAWDAAAGVVRRASVLPDSLAWVFAFALASADQCSTWVRKLSRPCAVSGNASRSWVLTCGPRPVVSSVL